MPARLHLRGGCFSAAEIFFQEAACLEALDATPAAKRISMVGDPRKHEASRGTYGAPQVNAELVAKRIRFGRTRIARLISQANLEA